MLEAVELLPLSFHSGMVLLLALLLRLLVCSRYISLHNVSMLKVYTDGMYVCSFFCFVCLLKYVTVLYVPIVCGLSYFACLSFHVSLT